MRSLLEDRRPGAGEGHEEIGNGMEVCDGRSCAREALRQQRQLGLKGWKSGVRDLDAERGLRKAREAAATAHAKCIKEECKILGLYAEDRSK